MYMLYVDIVSPVYSALPKRKLMQQVRNGFAFKHSKYFLSYKMRYKLVYWECAFVSEKASCTYL